MSYMPLESACPFRNMQLPRHLWRHLWQHLRNAQAWQQGTEGICDYLHSMTSYLVWQGLHAHHTTACSLRRQGMAAAA